MAKDIAYHEAVVQYNESLAEAAEKLAEEIDHEVVKKWCVAIGKQHRAHAKRHRKTLDNLKKETVVGIPVPEISDEDLARLEEHAQTLLEEKA